MRVADQTGGVALSAVTGRESLLRKLDPTSRSRKVGGIRGRGGAVNA